MFIFVKGVNNFGPHCMWPIRKIKHTHTNTHAHTVFPCDQERTTTLSLLAEKAKLTEEILNTVPGITCNPVQGAMYSFPNISLPQKAIKEAKVSQPKLLLLCC